MNMRYFITIALIASLTIGVQATPISFGQIEDAQEVRLKAATSTNTNQTGRAEGANTQVVAESLDQPEFVRLADGRLIPYGPGVICSESCVESEVIEKGFNRKWLIAVPIIAGVVIGIFLRGGPRVSPPTNVAGVTLPPATTPTPTPTPVDQPQPVPEPGTILLLGAGLALLSRKKLREAIGRVS